METMREHGIELSTLPTAETDAFLDLIDREFGCGPGRSMRQVCPTALDESNRGHRYVLRCDGVLASTAAALRRVWRTSWGRVDVAAVGCFATKPEFRRRGFSRQVQEFALEHLRETGCDVAVLWTDSPELYQARGFVVCGQETHLDLGSLDTPTVPAVRLRPAGADDASALARLYRSHPFGAERSDSDWSAYLDPEVSRILVVEGDGGLLAYAALGKGIDFEGYVHEYAGEPSLVHRLWAELRGEGARFALLPAGASMYGRGAASRCARREQPSAYARALSQSFAARDLTTWSFAAWGFDSA